MAKKLSEIEGIGRSFEEKLNAGGIKSVEDLLAKGADPKGRDTIATACEISPKQVMRWVNHADLFRISGIASQYAELLEAAGVDTVVELATRNAENLTTAMTAKNDEKNLCKSPPALKTVEGWVAQAKDLPRAVHY